MQTRTCLSSSYFSDLSLLPLVQDPLPAPCSVMSPRVLSSACRLPHSICITCGSSLSSAHVVSCTTYTLMPTKSLFSDQNIQLPAGHSIWMSLSPSESLSSTGTSSLFSTPAGITAHTLTAVRNSGPTPHLPLSLPPVLTIQAIQFYILNLPQICSQLSICIVTFQAHLSSRHPLYWTTSPESPRRPPDLA